MAWLDERIWCHPKITDLSDRAYRVYVNGLAYSAGMGTKGVLSVQQQRLLGGSGQSISQLIAAGLWDALEDGNIVIHDWRIHNGKRDERKAKDRERKKSARLSAGTSAGNPVERPQDGSALKEVKEVKVRASEELANARPSAQSLVAEYVDQCRALGADPPARAKGQVARQVGELLNEGQPAETISGAISLLVERRLHPSTLPTLLLEAAAGPARKQSAKGVSSRDIFAMTGRQIEAGS